MAVPVIGDNKAKIGHFHHVLPVTIDNNLSFTVVLREIDQLLINHDFSRMFPADADGFVVDFDCHHSDR